MNFEGLLIQEAEFWKIYFHQNQQYLGRCYLWAKRDGLIDLFDTSRLEREELFELGRNLKKTLNTLFQPDLFNYASLGNVSTHLHLHVIPRYKEPKVLGGRVFRDERWGKNYAPYNQKFRVQEQVLQRIKVAIIDELEKS